MKNLEVELFKKKDFFGEEDILKKQNRHFSVVCESQDGGELFLFTKNVLNSLIINNDRTKQYLNAKNDNKKQNNSKNLDNIC